MHYRVHAGFLVEAMQTLAHANNDELDLLELLELSGLAVLFLPIVVFHERWWRDCIQCGRNYETKVPIFLNLVPPPFMEYNVVNELEVRLNDERIFSEWRAISQSSNIEFRDLKKIKNIDNLEFQAPKRSQIVRVQTKEKRVESLVINSNDPLVIREVIAFANHISLNFTTSVLNDVQQESRRLASILGLIENNAPASTDGSQLFTSDIVEGSQRCGGMRRISKAANKSSNLRDHIHQTRQCLDFAALLFSIAGLITGTVLVLFRAAFRQRKIAPRFVEVLIPFYTRNFANFFTGEAEGCR